ncbi:MAG TPA: hypothetical protein ENN55_05835, partial [Firmicutes bacterium]|nr:hypothetical protein [Bacillota bacterium]
MKKVIIVVFCCAAVFAAAGCDTAQVHVKDDRPYDSADIGADGDELSSMEKLQRLKDENEKKASEEAASGERAKPKLHASVMA